MKRCKIMSEREQPGGHGGGGGVGRGPLVRVQAVQGRLLLLG